MEELTKFQRWQKAGGSLRIRYKHRVKFPELFPYIRGDSRAESINMAAVVPALVLLGVVGFYGWFIFFLGTGGYAAEKASDAVKTALPVTLAVQLNDEYQENLVTHEYQENLVTHEYQENLVTHEKLLNSVTVRTPTPSPTLAVLLPLGVSPTMSLVTPMPSPSPRPTSTLCAPGCEVKSVSVRLAWFWPVLGGSHCPDAGCSDFLSAGIEWPKVVGSAAACPAEWGLYGYVSVPRVGVYQCLHWLPMARCENGVCDVLILSPQSVVADWRIIWTASVYTGQ